MASSDGQAGSSFGGWRLLAATHWSMVLPAGHGDGQRARSALAELAVLAAYVVLLVVSPPNAPWRQIRLATGIISLAGLALVLAAAAVSTLLPERGLQDRLTGTWLVPR